MLAQLTSSWPKADPRYPMTAAERIAAIRPVRAADLRTYYKAFAGANHGELAIVGDFDATAIAAQIERLFGSFTSPRPYARLDGKVFGAPGASRSIAIKDKEMSQLVVAHDVALRDTDADYAAWLMLGQVLGGDTGSRLWMRLREKEGLSYGVSAWTYGGALDDAGGFGAAAIVAPQNLTQAKASMLAEINAIATGKVTEAELARAREGWVKQQDTNLASDGYVTASLAAQAERKRTMEFAKQLRARISAVTVADVERVARKYLQPSRLVIVDAGDLAKAK